ncbi:beta transducin [Fusarium circinatum]|uniref:Beta transducin n=1 Tax=Fusarium circinatum TaxID=48490 RepID=A0A8H5WLT8_FUSCI|nr:beta transducin [Fusarium circinatum]
MPLLYGEGPKSFLRLQEEIVKNHDDLSLFAWKQDSTSYGIGVLRGCFANSPAEFAHWLNIKIELNNFESGMEVSSKNVKMDDPDDEDNSLGILLVGSSRGITHFRFKPYELIKLPPSKALLHKDDYYDDYHSHNIYWEEKEAREELERKAISIRKSVRIQEARMMGHYQKPVFKIHWSQAVTKILKSVNGRSTKEYTPCFECHPSSASHEDGTLTWVTDFELEIYPQHVVSFVLATGLHWGPHDYDYQARFERAKLPNQAFWAVLLGEGRAYVTNARDNWDDYLTAIEELDEIHGDNSTIVRQIKRMDHKPYTALSYVWGDASQKGAIHLGGSAKEITASLDAALRDMRDKSRVYRIWADTLCIDQSNNAEKSAQVVLMGRIYSTAHHTVIRLGNSPAGFKKRFTNLKALRFSKILCFPRMSGFNAMTCESGGTISPKPSTLKMSSRPCYLIRSLVITQQRQPRIAMPLEDMISRRYGAFETPLSTLLSRRKGIGATDPRDVVFGHWGIVSDWERCDRFIKVAYDRDLARESVDAARYSLDATGIESLLSHAMNPSPITVPEITS